MAKVQYLAVAVGYISSIQPTEWVWGHLTALLVAGLGWCQIMAFDKSVAVLCSAMTMFVYISSHFIRFRYDQLKLNASKTHTYSFQYVKEVICCGSANGALRIILVPNAKTCKCVLITWYLWIEADLLGRLYYVRMQIVLLASCVQHYYLKILFNKIALGFQDTWSTDIR